MIQTARQAGARRWSCCEAPAPPSWTAHGGCGASDSGRRWMVPLLVFVCLTGLLLIVAAGVEALAPFVYAMF